MPKGVKALWNYSQTELDLESHSCIVSKQKSSFSSALGFIDAMQRTSCILQTTIFQMQFCSAISHAFRSGHNFRPCHFNPKRSLTPVHILGFAEQMTTLILKAQRTTQREQGRQDAHKQIKDKQETMQTTPNI
jgi:hypothetical protein